MPSLSDRPNLPYVDAIVKEVNRWRPVGPMGECFRVSMLHPVVLMMENFVVHRTSQDVY